MLDQTFELFGLLSVEGVVLEVNQTALASVAARKSEIVGKWFWETPWWQTEQLQQQLRDAIVTAASGQLVRYEMQFLAPNGILNAIDFSLKPVFDEGGRVMTLVAEGNDITARKQAEAILRQSEQRFRTLADNISQLLGTRIDPPPTFTIIIAPDLPTLHTKWLSLFQVFTNLISNAIKHHHRADGSLHISGRDLGDVYEFAIADDGPGIAPAQHDRVFEIFQAVNPQNRSDSTGIGLSIVKKIIETEGGTIRLESAIGKGTTFYFTCPKQS